MPTPKRFIAGAVCPRCAEMDKLTMYTDDNELLFVGSAQNIARASSVEAAGAAHQPPRGH